jgi:membrane fusion protein (multidrug efflux system)
MRRKKIFIIGIVIIIFDIGWMKFHHKKLPIQPQAVIVEIEHVKQASIPVSVHAVGTLAAARNVQIAPQTAGQVSEILFQDGLFVKAGTPLIQLNDAEYKAKFASAEANFKLNETTYARMAKLANKGIISRQDISKALADLKESKAAMQESRVMLDKMLLVAPFDGVAGKCLVSPGNYVSTGQGLVSLTDTHHLHVEYTISENYVALMKHGQSITVTASTFPGKSFTGTVSFIAPTINTQDRTISLYAEVPNEDQILVSGLFVNVEQALGEQNNALLIPAKSILATIDGQQVYTVVDGKAHTVTVEIGQRLGENVQIVKGLAVGDSVVTAGQEKIHDGLDVKVKTE